MNEFNEDYNYSEYVYNTLPIYHGKTQFGGEPIITKTLPAYSVGLIAMGIVALLFVTGVIQFNFLLAFFLFGIIGSSALMHRYVQVDYDTVANINPSGIKKTYNFIETYRMLDWDEIEYIKIIKRYNGTKSKVIYIRSIFAEDNKETRKPNKIVLPYSPKMVHCILTYWNKEIQNLSEMKSWQRYVKRL